MRVLVVEDNDRLGRLLVRALQSEGHVVELARDGEEALLFTETGEFEVVVLDLMLPKLDGLGVLDRMRSSGDATPVLILTARDDVTARVDGLDRGGDDYLVKPFDVDELLARLRALVRRAQRAGTSSTQSVADLEIDFAAQQARRGGQELRLSRREWVLLECLAYRRGRIVDRQTLLANLYDAEDQPESNVLEVHIAALRRKIDRGREPKLIHTRRGQGYLLSEAP